MSIDKVIDLLQDAVIEGSGINLSASQVRALGEFLRRAGL